MALLPMQQAQQQVEHEVADVQRADAQAVDVQPVEQPGVAARGIVEWTVAKAVPVQSALLPVMLRAKLQDVEPADPSELAIQRDAPQVAVVRVELVIAASAVSAVSAIFAVQLPGEPVLD